MNIRKLVFWTKNYLFRRNSYNAYREANGFDSLTGEKKSMIEFAKQKKLVEYAYKHVKFYKEYYDKCGFNPSTLETAGDWDKIPVLEKDIIRTNPQSLISDEYSTASLSITTTGGSTGTPLQVYKMKNVPIEVMGWRAFKWWGIDPSANTGILHRRTPVTFLAKLKNRLMWWPTKRAYLNASTICETDIVKFINDIKRQHTVWLQGYCSSLECVADYIIAHNIEIDILKMVWSTSSPLSQTVRIKLENAFRCKVMDQYGCCEMWNVAIQKPNEPYLTICNDFVHVDVVREDNTSCAKGEVGDILITDLNSFGFPLIKYRLGDKSSIAETCASSADGYPKMNFVKGRITDSIILPGNKGRIDGAFLTTICDQHPTHVDSFQIYQKQDYSVSLKLVLKPNISKEDKVIVSIINSLRERLGSDVSFTSEVVDSIPGDRGKKRYIISEVALNQQKH